jgi:hypothetical protein
MAQDDGARRAVHDLGGLPGGAIDRAEHDVTFWEQRIDAMLTLLANHKRRLMDTAELRRGIESLGPDAYESLSYYERWAASIAAIMVEKGVLGQDELDERIAEIKARAEDGQ